MADKKSPGIGKQAANGFIWVILLLLIVGLAGFGATSFGGSQAAVVTVGARPVDANQYLRAAREALRRDQQQQGRTYTMADPRAQQIAQQVRTELVAAAAVENEAIRLGISIGDDQVADQIASNQAFQGAGGFNQLAFEEVLGRLGMSQRAFIENVRHETSRFLLQNAVSGGVAQTESYIDQMLSFVGQRRSFKVATFAFDDDDGTPPPLPSDEDLQSFYDDNPGQFTLPERKRITYIWITPEQLAETTDVTDEQLQALYDDRIDEYRQPARRLVERLAFADTDAANAAKTQIEAGETTFDAVVEGRNLTLADVDLGEVTVEALGENGPAIFALTEPGIVGPLDTGLGPALFRVNAILEAREITLDEARDDLQTIAALDAARRRIDGALGDIDDLLASGATLEEAADETDLVLGQIDYTPTSEEPIAGYPAFRRVASQVTEDDFPEVDSLSDGGIFALRLDEVVPPELQQLADVRQVAIEAWQQDRRIALLREQANILDAQIGVGAAIDGGDAAVETVTQVTRDAPTAGVPPSVTQEAFTLEEGKTAVVEAGGSVYLVQLTSIEPPDFEDERIQLVRDSLQQQAGISLGQDIFTMYSNALVERTGQDLNGRVLNAVHAELP
ncbi:peptidyl-prolyl cis-trans isomerase [Actibacterium sp. 188UL27-1]|uniref:peptidyl-prolyl cis-trans isomerase n=1 Tax=Actibacterium sp. 188UL27-1 TaxID=2786961 RepID=UPI001958427F|nr:peptidyl-prolyl cis-trans isomerase [Actibacterium sp. 188UL27-1]MBM7067643.1 peptidyl-prolyl cis-trans isomerase [Actibacterium sp. 188UL27-1]